jgi:hypothetical protein
MLTVDCRTLADAVLLANQVDGTVEQRFVGDWTPAKVEITKPADPGVDGEATSDSTA